MDWPAGILGSLMQLAGPEMFLELWMHLFALAMGIIGGVAALIGFVYLGVTVRFAVLMEKVRRT